jgi:hypothetical protein
VKLLDQFKGMAQSEAGLGDTILFWTDMWNGRVLQLSYPQLFSFAMNKDITLGEVLVTDSFQQLFSLPFQKKLLLSTAN